MKRISLISIIESHETHTHVLTLSNTPALPQKFRRDKQCRADGGAGVGVTEVGGRADVGPGAAVSSDVDICYCH